MLRNAKKHKIEAMTFSSTRSTSAVLYLYIFTGRTLLDEREREALNEMGAETIQTVDQSAQVFDKNTEQLRLYIPLCRYLRNLRHCLESLGSATEQYWVVVVLQWPGRSIV